MLRTHHERFDASGYPAGVPIRQIPLLGRIAGIVDSFDAMTSVRPFRPALSRSAALQVLYRERGHLYQPELVEQFVQCLGVYPVGTLVELSTGEVGIVMAQNPTRRLRPKLMLLTNPDKRLRENFLSLDLLTMRYGKWKTATMHIVRSLDPALTGWSPPSSTSSRRPLSACGGLWHCPRFASRHHRESRHAEPQRIAGGLFPPTARR